jgi:isochorismate synthase EntC
VTAADAPDAPLRALDDLPRDDRTGAARVAARPPGAVRRRDRDARSRTRRVTPSSARRRRRRGRGRARLVAALYDAAALLRAPHAPLVARELAPRRARARHLAEEIRDAAADAAAGRASDRLPLQTSTITSSLDPDAYAARVARIHDYIAAGDVYQVNLTERFETRLPRPALDVYGRMRAHPTRPFGAYLDCGPERVLSSSPELFLRRRGARASSPARSRARARAAPTPPPTRRSPPSSRAIPRSAPST